MNKAMNLLRGSARLEISGGFPEQFINTLAAKGIEFWGFKKLKGGRAEVNIPLRALAAVERLKPGLECEVRVLKKKGLPHFLYGLRRRWALFAGLVLCLLGVTVLSLFVWEIEVQGNVTVPESEILSVLDKLGVHIGTFALSIDQQDLRSRALAEIGELSWLTVNVRGTKAEVIVRERIPKPEIVDEDTPTTVVASKGGVITKMNVYKGLPLVNVGDTVAPGDVLVGAEVASLNSGTRLVHAMADVYARTWYEFSCEMPLEYTAKNYTGAKKQKRAIILLGKRINLSLTTGFSHGFCDKIIKKSQVILPGNSHLPVRLITEVYEEYEPEKRIMEISEAEQILKERLTRRLDKLVGDGEKSKVEFKTDVSGNLIRVTLTAECIEQIGKIQELP